MARTSDKWFLNTKLYSPLHSPEASAISFNASLSANNAFFKYSPSPRELWPTCVNDLVQTPIESYFEKYIELPACEKRSDYEKWVFPRYAYCKDVAQDGFAAPDRHWPKIMLDFLTCIAPLFDFLSNDNKIASESCIIEAACNNEDDRTKAQKIAREDNLRRLQLRDQLVNSLNSYISDLENEDKRQEKVDPSAGATPETPQEISLKLPGNVFEMEDGKTAPSAGPSSSEVKGIEMESKGWEGRSKKRHVCMLCFDFSCIRGCTLRYSLFRLSSSIAVLDLRCQFNSLTADLRN